ncbi:MAG: hypothetical protein K9J42_04915 [Sulfuritalea sp.]|nr:hypothetical protein [Sulfuritalea sp.]
MSSIRNRLLFWQISALIVTGLLVSYLAYSLAWNGFNKLRDYTLEQVAYSILRHGVELDVEGISAKERRDKGQFLSQMWGKDGKLIYASRATPELPPQLPGNAVVSWEGVEWHTFTMRKGDLVIQVANTTENRAGMFGRIAPWLLLPLAVLVAFLGSLIWVAVGRALRPLEQVRREIGRRGSSSMEELATTGLPDEVQPLVTTLNELLARLQQSMSLQRRFTADATHELRTPLAAVRLQAQLALKANSSAEREEALQELIGGVDRAAHLVDQLLQMTRLEPDAMPVTFTAVSLGEIARHVVASFQNQARLKNIDLGLGHCDDIYIAGDRVSVQALLNNLVANALIHCPAGSHVDVELHRNGSMAELKVYDDGPGIPADERQRVFDRFYRLPGTDTIGSGLGLAIVRQVVNLHHGTVSLDDAIGGGLLVRVKLPTDKPD